MTHTQSSTKAYSLLSDLDIFLFKEGKHFDLFEKLGSHLVSIDGIHGTYFAMWAPNARQVHVIGEFNGWNRRSHPLFPRWDESGIWEGFIPHVGQGSLYKYLIDSKLSPEEIEKGDPFAFFCELPSKTASIVWDLDYTWKDKKWMETRGKKIGHHSPMSIYELHLGSWKKKSPFESLSYKELAEELPAYLKKLHFTHVEFMPVMEHPFYGSWGYQKTGYFAPSSRYGTPQELMALIDAFHQEGIGVLFDWVPSHFPSDPHSLASFDGSALFEHHDPKLGFHPDWKSCIFNYGRHEVRSFLISSALFWIKKYHGDGLRVDAVSSMLYLDYSKKEGEWLPNTHGGNENLEAIYFLKTLNEHLYQRYPDIHMIAEESTAWPMVSRPTSVGGLGFGFKWSMGWMHDTLQYFSQDPIYRKYDHNRLLFSLCYIFHENFILSFSHDEVVYGKKSLLNKMPGDVWQKFANLRLLYSYMYTHPGKKLLFMGNEIAQWKEWDHNSSLDWDLLNYPSHQGIFHIIQKLNQLYKHEPGLHYYDHDPAGFQWIHLHDHNQSVIAYMRKSHLPSDDLLVLCNFTPVPRELYQMQLDSPFYGDLIFNSDSSKYFGSDFATESTLNTQKNKDSYFLTVTLPPLACLIYKKSKSL